MINQIQAHLTRAEKLIGVEIENGMLKGKEKENLKGTR